MTASSRPRVNHLGRDVSARIPAWDVVPGLVALGERDEAIWALAAPYLTVRDNDAHSLYSFGLAAALLSQLPEANEAIVLPAILLHDTGWSTVDERDALEAIAPGGGRPDLVLKHEKEGARIAREILETVGLPPADIDQITDIIDGHDSRLTSLSLEDSIVKDADKLWRVSPHGRAVVCDWFGIDDDEALRLCAYRAYNELFTEQARAMSRALVAVGSIERSSQISRVFRREGQS
jgi:hypothetical protein